VANAVEYAIFASAICVVITVAVFSLWYNRKPII